MKKILIIMPVYNQEKLLKRSIHSILDQTYTNFTLVVINDGSIDNTGKEADKFLYDARVKVIHNEENYGCYYSRNLGLKFMESGEYDFFTIQDSDDFSQPERFEKIVEAFDSDSQIISVYNHYLRFGKDAPKWHNKPFQPIPDLAHAVFSKYIFERLGYFDNMPFGADQEYWERARSICHTTTSFIYLLSDVLYYAEMTGTNLIKKYGIQPREQYKYKWRPEVAKMEINNEFYRPFFKIDEINKWHYQHQTSL
jgi:glycosyltransferase involved in cell wall biosynthesis